jgi:hypothetical protein
MAVRGHFRIQRALDKTRQLLQFLATPDGHFQRAGEVVSKQFRDGPWFAHSALNVLQIAY